MYGRPAGWMDDGSYVAGEPDCLLPLSLLLKQGDPILCENEQRRRSSVSQIDCSERGEERGESAKMARPGDHLVLLLGFNTFYAQIS